MDSAAVAIVTSAVDFATIITGIGAVTAAVALVLVSIRGATMLLDMIHGDKDLDADWEKYKRDNS